MSNAPSVSFERPADDGPRNPYRGFKPPDRVQTNILAERERAVLDGLCRQMPDWITPDGLTATGSIGAAIASLSYIATNLRPEFLFVASLGVLINWFGDSLDGSLARHRGIERPRYGYFIDHSVDAFNQLIFALGLGLSPYVSLAAALFLSCSYYLLSINVFLSAQTSQEFKLTYLYAGPTELRLLIIFFNVIVYCLGPVKFMSFGSETSLYSILITVEAIIFVGLYVFEVISTLRKLKQDDHPR